ncbi:MAG: 4,5-DOPA dioxygenase extradiol [Flavobacteriales bacterium]|nr:4,5-DOPA dioxygenase extradiol [Flavobacteriales bacterium]MCB9166248.1 4,5-DOPA dioxygenase extradiol [Flavobacteriales bacterium]
MDRQRFVRMMAMLPAAASLMDLRTFARITEDLGPAPRMPALFIGHGSPMNAIEENRFVAEFRRIGRELPRPHAILCISAHWETRGMQVTAMERPRTIHDFGGFPPELYAVQYPAPGDPQLAEDTHRLLAPTPVSMDQSWGLDHGAWSVIKHLYPQADVPVVQLSLDRGMDAEQHYAMARQLAPLRDRGVLVIGSGNMVHNLGLVAWEHLDDPYGYDWALEARARMKELILSGDHLALQRFADQGRAFQLAIPTPEHYLPLLYALALQGKGEAVSLFNDEPLAGSLAMTSVKIDRA